MMYMGRIHVYNVILMSTAVLCIHSLTARAAEVRLRLSSREAYVGAPIVVQLSVDDAGAHDVPVLPDIPGVLVRALGSPSRSTQTTIINGRRSQTTSVTYAWELTPRREGKYEIPAVPVKVDGQTYRTDPVSFVARKSETGDLLFVDVAGAAKRAYVGEALRLTLRVWIRPYMDSRYNVKLTEADMWGLISLERSRWGVFGTALEELATRRQRPPGREVLRKDSEGVERRYYLYELDHVVRPAKPGVFDPGDVDVVMAYPMGLKESDGFFSMGELALAGTRPLVKRAEVEPIDIRAIPAAHRPAGFNGAVGRFDISTSALPQNVSVGEPITLTLTVRGDGNIETLSAPNLANLPELTRDFRVPDEPLAGVMENGAKVFTVSLRPRHAEVKQIPPIPLVFFDPRLETFVTSRSEAIRLHVTPAETLSMDRVVSAAPTAVTKPAASSSAPHSSITAEDRTVTPALIHRQRLLTGGRLVAVMMIPPLTFVGLAAGARWRNRRKNTSRQRLAGRLAKERLGDASDPAQIASTVIGYIADRLDEPLRNVTGSEALGRLRRKGGSARTLAQTTDLLGRCEEFRYGGSSPRDLKALTTCARLCVDAIEADVQRGERT
jgi:hypothetical protein